MTASFAECRAAAREALGAELGRVARGSARPRGLAGLVRARGPIAVQLWVGDREHRVVRQRGLSFALIEPPAVEQDPLLRGRPSLVLARIADRHWELLVGFGPAVVLLLATAALAVTSPARWAGVVCGLLVLVWIAVLMTAFVVRALAGVVRTAVKGGDRDRLAVQALSGTHWHLSLCHQPAEHRCAELLSQASIRTTERIATRARRAAADHGVVTDGVHVTRDLVFLLSGATTSAMRAAMNDVAGAAYDGRSGAEVVIVTRPGRLPEPKRLPFDNGSFALLYIVGVTILTAAIAGYVATRERSACPAADCADRPATYGSALRWLVSNLAFADAGLHPATAVYVFGLLFRVLGLVSVVVVVMALYRFAVWQKGAIARMEKPVKPTLVIVTAKQLERDAVIAAVTAVNGQTPRRDFSTRDSVVGLGEVGGVEILLATATGQGTIDPNGALFTALNTGRYYRPRYMLLCGICYGLDEDRQKIGDVLVSQRVIDIDHRAELPDRVVVRGVNVPPGRLLLSRFQATTIEPLPYQVHFGQMVSSGSLVDSPEYRAKIKYLVPHAIGGDMEGAAVYAAAATNGIEWIVVKGISDQGRDKSYAPQPRAAANAADFVVRTLQFGGLVDTTETALPGER